LCEFERAFLTMLRNKIYYSFKPFIPRTVRLGIRSWVTTRKRDRIHGTWPILPGTENPPDGWPGWPEGKRFALILTHDVEGQAGVDKTRNLMELEAKLGFRSAFNFIPEGDYRVSKTLRAELTANGFEVGVHDLHHDGKLYSSRAAFAQRARRINEYLKDWGAVGFRSGFMLHNLEWLGDLNALYDASTFDTDPFEPQPDGAGTIFPFWVPRLGDPAGLGTNSANDSGYIELPYTLAQDSTMFLLLRERHPDIWFQKLDWIARHGGMALVNVHPDYVRFGNEPASDLTFPSDCYSRFLEYARQRYGDTFWHPLPRDLAAYAAQFKPARPHKAKRVCMVSYSDYHSDTRVMRYAEALAARGDQVDMLALRPSPDVPREQKLGNIHLFNIQDRFAKNERWRTSFLSRILRFLAVASFRIGREHRREPYDLLHIHNVPDFLVFSAWLPKLTGAKVVLDIHDILPEFYENKFGASENSIFVRLLKLTERFSSRVADHVIIANHLWLERYAARTRSSDKCSVFINNVESHVFRPLPRTRKDGKFIILFPGGLQWHQGLDIAIRAFEKISSSVPHAQFHIYGDGNMKQVLLGLTKSLNMGDKIQFFEPLPVSSIAQVMADADLGVVPKRADSFGNQAYSTKIMEFMSVGVPVIVSSTAIDRYYFDDGVVRFFDSGSHESLAKGMLELIQDPAKLRSLSENGLKYAAQNCWDLRRPAYLHLIDSLLAGQRLKPDLDDRRMASRAKTAKQGHVTASHRTVAA
jgi:glycosyltransferase involved in cell wall biosynthesis